MIFGKRNLRIFRVYESIISLRDGKNFFVAEVIPQYMPKSILIVLILFIIAHNLLKVKEFKKLKHLLHLEYPSLLDTRLATLALCNLVNLGQIWMA
jgi:hypothetical protein